MFFPFLIPEHMVTEESISVLIIDDEEDAVQLLSHLLRDIPGVRVVGTASNASDALSLIRQLRSDMVFLDIEMPDRSGFDVLQKLRSDGIEPTVVFITAYLQYQREAERFKVFDFLLKPISRIRLEKTIYRYREMRA